MKKLQPDDPRLTAYALGELPPKEARVVARLAEENSSIAAEMMKTQALGRLLCETYEREGLSLHPMQRAVIRRVGQSQEVTTLASFKRRNEALRGSAIALAAAACIGLVLFLLSRTPIKTNSVVENEPEELLMEVVLSPASLVSWGPSRGLGADAGSGAEGSDGAQGGGSRSSDEEQILAARQKFTNQVLNDPQRFFASAELTARRQSLPEPSSFVSLEENHYLSTLEQPVTTVPVMAGRTSFAWVERFLRERGELPPRDAVRLEELVNYPDYREDAQAQIGGVALSSELVPCPWNEGCLLLGILLQREPGSSEKEQVSLQLEIDDEHVAEYRLLGFAQPNGELIPATGGDASHPLAAGNSTYVFYEIRPGRLPFDSTPLGRVALKVTSDESASPVHRNIDVPSIPGRWLDSSDSFRTAATLAAYALVLRDSPYKGSLDLARVESLAKQTLLDHSRPDAATREVLQLIIQTRKLAGV